MFPWVLWHIPTIIDLKEEEVVVIYNFVAKLDKSVYILGTHYLWLAFEVRAILWDWALTTVESDTTYLE